MIRGYTHNKERARMRRQADRRARTGKMSRVGERGDLVASITPMGGSRVDVKSDNWRNDD